MADVLSRRKRRRQTTGGMLDTALDYAAMGWPVCRGVEPGGYGERACACDRMGCPDPGAHPVSAVWGLEATTDPEKIALWWTATPGAGIILPTGRVFDVFDVPAGAGVMALARMGRSGIATGPVAAVDGLRYLFFVATRGAPDNEDEWWSCHLDCVPETDVETPGLRWHCRDSYVLAPPSRLPSGRHSAWIRSPRERSGPVALPDPIVVLDILADACEEFGG